VSGLRFDEALLPNGLRVIGEHNPRAASVALGFLVETGVRDEEEDENGVSHFLEHLCFKSTATRPAMQVSRDFDALGASYNAFTSSELTAYHGAVLPDAAPRLLELLTDMLRPALLPDDVDVERQVVLEEIAMDADRPASLVYERARAAYFAGHPIGRDALGTNDSLRSLTPERVRAYLERRYRTGSILVVATGAYDWDAVVGELREATAGWPTGRAERWHPPLVPSPGRHEVRSSRVTRAHLAMVAPGVGRADVRLPAAALLGRVLGGGDTSRLFRALVETGIAEEAGLYHDDADGFGTFDAYLSTDEESLAEATDILHAVLDEAQREGLEEREWSAAQRTLATSLTLRGETPMGRLVTVGSAYLDRGRYESVGDVVDELLATPLEAGLALLAERPFDDACLAVLRPEVT
jgi:predicted Zn-dependent peptidase